MAAEGRELEQIRDDVVVCRACPRLVAWREQIAREKVARYTDQDYWGRPVPGFGDPAARVVILGLAPAAHGGNRTGRIFTGDRSGDFLFASLHRTGFANKASSIGTGDGLAVEGAYLSAVNRCAPPANRPTPAERDRCLPFLGRELDALQSLRVVVALGAFAWEGGLRALAGLGDAARPKPRFAHAAEIDIGPVTLLGCYHPSQQNTFTGKLTPPMMDAVMERAAALAGRPLPRGPARRRDGARAGRSPATSRSQG